MSGPVGTHLVLGCEYLPTTSLAGEVTLFMNICVVELLHALSPKYFSTLSAGKPFTRWNILLRPSRIDRSSLIAD